MDVLDQWTLGSFLFSIEPATVEDAEAIVRVAREAFYQTKTPVPLKPEFRKEFEKADVPRRLHHPETYQVLVCKTNDTIVGTVYYQTQKTDYTDEKGVELPELGMLAVDPSFKSYFVGGHLVDAVVQRALKDRCRGIYLYLFAHQSKLLRFYERAGFKFVENHISYPQKWFDGPEGRVEEILMLKNLSPPHLKVIYNVREKRKIGID